MYSVFPQGLALPRPIATLPSPIATQWAITVTLKWLGLIEYPDHISIEAFFLANPAMFSRYCCAIARNATDKGHLEGRAEA
jgi:hypothetical protein